MESEEDQDSTDVIVEKQPNYLREEFHKPEESTVNSLEDEPLMIHSSSTDDLEIINETLSTNPVGQSLVVCDPSPSASVCITNIPHNCDLESHLRVVLDVQVLNIEFSDDMLSASIELADVTDLSFLVNNKHFYKKKVLEFVNASIEPAAEPDIIEVEDIESDSSTSLSIQPNTLKVTFAAQIQGKDSIIKESLIFMFENDPYSLQVSSCVFNENKAFLTFVEDNGVSLVISNPPLSVLAIDIEVTAVDFTESPTSDPLEYPSVLVIDDLPTKLPDDTIKLQLEFMFQIKGYEVIEYRMENKTAHVMFSGVNAVSELINDPPDESTFLGHPIKYSGAMKMPEYSGPCVLSVKGLPLGFPGIQKAVEIYIENVTKTKPVYCHVVGNEAMVKFQDDKVAKKLAIAPSVLPLLGKTLEFSIVPETLDISEPSTSTSMPNTTKQSQPPISRPRLIPDPRPIPDSRTIPDPRPFPRPRPIPRPRTRETHSFLLVKNLPAAVHYDKQSLIDYLEFLTSEKCEDIQINNSMREAAVRMSEAIDVKALQPKLETDWFDEDVMLEIEPLTPSYSCLIKSDKPLKTSSIKWHCKKHVTGELTIQQKGNNMEHIVKFNSKIELDSFMNADGCHNIGNTELHITHYHPMFSDDSESPPPPVPRRERSTHLSTIHSPPLVPPRHSDFKQSAIYQYMPFKENISIDMERYLHHFASDCINKDLMEQGLHGEAHVLSGVIEIRPFGPANTINDWQEKVQKVLEKYKKQLCSKSIPYNPNCKHVIIEALQKHQQEHSDFYYMLEGTCFKISGCKSSVEKALHLVQHVIEHKVQETRSLKNTKQHIIEYLMKFEKDKIESLHPPVTLSKDRDDPDTLILTGVKHSVDGAEEMIRDRIAKVREEIVPLTRSAYHLLNSPKGKSKLQSIFEEIIDKIYYVYAQNPLGGNYTHRVYIMSPEAELSSIAKKNLESLCNEEIVPIPKEKIGVTSSKQWQEYDAQLHEECFISVRVNKSETITITGMDADVKIAHDKVKTFLDKQHESTEDFEVKGPVWRVIKNSSKKKLSKVKKVASERKVKLKYPESGEDDSNGEVVIVIQGSLKDVADIKAHLKLLIKEVISDESLRLTSKPGLRKLDNDGTLSQKFRGIMQSRAVEICYEVTEDIVDEILPDASMMTRPQRLLHAITDGGTTIHVLHGAYAKQKCDLIVTFIPVRPTINEEVFVSLKTVGGQKVLDDIEASFIMPNEDLVSGRIHQTNQTGNLQCQEIYHVVLPSFDVENRAKTFLKQMMDDIFCKAFRAMYSNIVLCPATIPPLNYPVNVFTNILIASLRSCGMYSNDSVVQIFVHNPKDADDFNREFRELGVHITALSGERHLPIPAFHVKGIEADNALKNSIKISQGSIIEQQADVYLNSTNPEMNFSQGALSKLYKEKCGKPLLNEIESYKKKNDKLKYGEVAITSAHNLKAKAIYHIILKGTDQSDYIDVFKATLEKVLLTAKQNGYKSIAIPCLGVSGLGYLPEISAAALFESVISFHKKYPLAITEFQFLGFHDQENKALQNEYEKRFMHNDQKPSNANFGSRLRNASLNVEVCKGDITLESVNVIVNSTSYDLRADANQISKAVFGAGGDEMHKACKKLVDNGTSLKDGNVVATSKYGRLKCAEVYHIHVPGKAKRDDPPSKNEASSIKKVIQKCLIMAERSKHVSICFPSFCLGVGNYTIEQSGKLMFDSFKEFSETASPQYLKLIHVVILDLKLYSEFCEYFQRYFSSISSNSATLHVNSQPSVSPSSSPFSKPKENFFSYNPVLPLKQLKTKSSISFKIYGIDRPSINLAIKDLQAFIKRVITERTVDLRGTMRLFHKDEFKEINDLAQKRGVEVDPQLELERIFLTGEETNVEIVAKNIETIKAKCSNLIIGLQKYEWVAADDPSGDTFSPYAEELMKQIEAAHIRKLPFVNVTADQVHVTIDLNEMIEIDQVTSTSSVTRLVKRRQRKIEIDPPGQWDRQPIDRQGNKMIVHFVQVGSLTAEYDIATKKFISTLGNTKCIIISVMRIQNPGEYSKYMSLKHSLEALDKIKEMEVFHGTKLESIQPICSQGGFNRGLAAESNAAVFGKGVYYAANSSYSLQDKYSEVDSSGYKHILVCSLLVGLYVKGTKDMKVAPSLPNNSMRKYDTLVDDETNPTIFVAMTDAQAYPRYWITFKKDK